MREIRFRAWVSDNGDPPQMIYYEKMELDNGMWFRNPDAIHTSDIHEIMQFTGLRDKNGKEIYEGDILRVNNAELIETVAENGYWKEVYGDVTGPVIYEDGAFHYTGHSSGPLPLWTNDNEYEVIGNIYEHRHLLNQEK